MKQPLKNNKINNKVKKSIITKTNQKPKKKTHPQYGTSKLEEDFAKNFLDKLGLEYTYQFEAKDIGRYYDFYCQGVLIEIDGDYFHSNPLLYEETDLNRMQKKNKKIDEYKNNWALTHGFPILRIWETDIRKHPDKVMKMLKEVFYKDNEVRTIHKTSINVLPKRKMIKR